jgi:hypothetical protein
MPCSGKTGDFHKYVKDGDFSGFKMEEGAHTSYQKNKVKAVSFSFQ